jgi:hypothetical protein
MKVTAGPFRPRPSRLRAAGTLVSLRLRGLNPLKLATSMNSLARAPRRTMEPWYHPSLVQPRRHGFLREGLPFRPHRI